MTMPALAFPLILASGSPRRRALLAEVGYDFTVIAPSESAECGVCSRETPPELVARLAYQKAQDVAPQVARGIVLGCDTVAECMGQILGKPANQEHARQMLELLRGREHHVYSGVCLWRRPDDVQVCWQEVSRVAMRAMGEDEIDTYLATRTWEGCSGAYAVQEGEDPYVRVVAGSVSNVIGLPMETLRRVLPLLAPA